jgi:hypothetical protein
MNEEIIKLLNKITELEIKLAVATSELKYEKSMCEYYKMKSSTYFDYIVDNRMTVPRLEK